MLKSNKQQETAEFTSLSKELRDLWRNEGLKGYFRGFGSSFSLSLMRSGIFFPIYEYSKFNPVLFLIYKAKPLLSDKFGLQVGSLVASFAARAISILCSFPLEYRATVQMTDRMTSGNPRKMGNYTTGLT